MSDQELTLKDVISQIKQVNTQKRLVQEAILENLVKKIESDAQTKKEIKDNYKSEKRDDIAKLLDDIKADISRSTFYAKQFPATLLDTMKAKASLLNLNLKKEGVDLSQLKPNLEAMKEKRLCQSEIRKALKRNDFETAKKYVDKAQEINDKLLEDRESKDENYALLIDEKSNIINSNIQSMRLYKEGIKSNLPAIYAEYSTNRAISEENKNQALAVVQNKGFMAKIKNLFTKFKFKGMKTQDKVAMQVSEGLSTMVSGFKSSVKGLLDSMVQSNNEKYNQLIQTALELEADKLIGPDLPNIEPTKENPNTELSSSDPVLE